jgi:hypothetical protein
MANTGIRQLIGTLVVAITVIGASGPSWAVDGVTEINQAAALAGGVAAGDLPGFPVTIGSDGNFRLTSSLAPQTSGTAIEITAIGVNLDLNGFRIVCDVNCAQQPPGFAIDASATSITRVENGSLLYNAGMGIALGAHSHVSNVQVFNATDSIVMGDYASVDNVLVNNGKGSAAISVGNNSRVSDVQAIDTSGAGVVVGENSIVARAHAYSNIGDGILADVGSTISQSVSSSNQGVGRGIHVTEGTVVDCVTRNNAGDGISIGVGVASRNTATANTGDGIDCGRSCSVVGNTVRDNAEHGLEGPFSLILCSGIMGYGQNVIESNTGGTIGNVGCTDELNQNVCDGNLTCP